MTAADMIDEVHEYWGRKAEFRQSAEEPFGSGVRSLDGPLERHKNIMRNSPLSDHYWAKRLNRPIDTIREYRDRHGRKTT